MTDTTDRELLELAALAYWGDEIDDVCSIEWSEEDQAIGYTHADNQDHNGQDRTFLWNPLTDDGDALRLACDLEIDVSFRVVGGSRVEALAPGGPRIIERYTQASERASATRLAIVRAAAAIGEKML